MAYAKPSSFPLRGILFFLTHPSLWYRCICGLFIMLLISIASLVGFSFAISPTAHALVRANCPEGLAWVVAVILMLIESALAVIIMGLILMPFLQDALFDQVLRLRGLEQAILKPAEQHNMLFRAIGAGILFGLFQVLVLLLTLPVHAIVIVGSILVVMINGIILAWGYMLHYLIELRGMSFGQSRHWVSLNRKSYMSFGTVAFLLELIPLFNIMFMFTNAVGAALWAEWEYHKEIKNRGQPGYEYYAAMPLPLSLDGTQ
ncbi:hypothetical protein IWQ62_005426 [Dispira parvispora]|uniref:Uncharacterized protein n=1 Tax=Dispira parvispora TaxID=1520584 RepID=A0A9W8E4R0_9FUNG|nr:hypothetical protein IWQ62_005426 [Dispira parvispora]